MLYKRKKGIIKNTKLKQATAWPKTQTEKAKDDFNNGKCTEN